MNEGEGSERKDKTDKTIYNARPAHTYFICIVHSIHTLHLILYTMYHIMESGRAEEIFSSWWKSFTIFRFTDNNNDNDNDGGNDDDDDSHLIHTYLPANNLTPAHTKQR